MLRGLRPLWALFLGLALFTTASGIAGTLLGLRAALEGFTPFAVGWIMAAYSIGLLGGSLAAPRLIDNVGHIRVFAGGASLASAVVLLHPIFIGGTEWFVFRFAVGGAFAMLWVISESWLNRIATNDTRGKILGLYSMTMYGAFGLGQILINLAPPEGFELFILASALTSLALVPLALVKIRDPDPESYPKPVRVSELYQWSPVAVVAGFMNGMGQLALFGMAAVYGSLKGFSVATVTTLVLLPVVGVLIAQFPVGALSDRRDRRALIAALAGATTLIAVVAFVLGLKTPILNMAFFFAFGCLALPLHSLTMAHANDRLEPEMITSAAGKISLIFGTGAIFGPLLAGAGMNVLGANGFLLVIAATYAVTCVFASYRCARYEAPSLDGQSEFALAPARATPVVAAAYAEEYADTEQDTENNPT